jgi:hypothetical protein
VELDHSGSMGVGGVTRWTSHYFLLGLNGCNAIPLIETI